MRHLAATLALLLTSCAVYDTVENTKPYGSIYMDTASGAISFDDSWAGNVIDDGTSTWAAGDANDGFTVDATGKLSPSSSRSAGQYLAIYQISFTGTNSVDFHATVSVDNNSTQETQCETHRGFSAATPYGSMSGVCTVTVSYTGAATDDVLLSFTSDEAGGANATFGHVQLVLKRL